MILPPNDIPSFTAIIPESETTILRPAPFRIEPSRAPEPGFSTAPES